MYTRTYYINLHIFLLFIYIRRVYYNMYKILWSYAIARPGGPVGRALTEPETAAVARGERKLKNKREVQKNNNNRLPLGRPKVSSNPQAL